jgi:hypothetical protein
VVRGTSSVYGYEIGGQKRGVYVYVYDKAVVVVVVEW